MNKKTLFFSIFAVSGMILSLGSAILSGNVSYSKADASVGNYSTSASTYYSGITAISGATLLGQLHDLLATTHKTYTTYDDCKNPTYVYATDAGTSSSYVRDFCMQKILSYPGAVALLELGIMNMYGANPFPIVYVASLILDLLDHPMIQVAQLILIVRLLL